MMNTKMLKFCALALVFGLVSCEEDLLIGGEGGAEQQLGEYLIEAEGIASNMYNTIDFARRDSAFIASGTTVINGVTVSSNGDTIKINYTAAGTYGSDGKLRKGMLRVVESGNYMMVNGLLNAHLMNFSIDDVPVIGSITAKNEGNDSISVSVQNFSVNNAFTFNSSKGIKWLSGFSTINDESDDRYSLGGTSTVDENGTNHSVTVDFTDNLIYDRTCQYGAVSGILDLSLSGDSVSYDSGTIDFIASDGCNNAAILTIVSGDKTLNFTKTFDAF
jgi:hypothetical protein